LYLAIDSRRQLRAWRRGGTRVKTRRASRGMRQAAGGGSSGENGAPARQLLCNYQEAM